MCTLPFLQVRGGVEPPKKFFKNGGTWQDLSFYSLVTWKEGGDFFQRGRGKGGWVAVFT